MKTLKTDGTFNFGDTDDRYELTCVDDFTWGHYKLDDGSATVCGACLDGKLYYGVSFCSPKDNFSRKIGIIRARNNLVKESSSKCRGVYIIPNDLADAPPALVFLYALRYHLTRMGQRPSWVKNCITDFRNLRRVKKVEHTVKSTSCPKKKCCSFVDTNKRSEAAKKAWETRRSMAYSKQ